MVRFPGAWRLLAGVALRVLSPRSRLRRVLLRRQVISGWDATSRGDLELALVRFAPDVQVEFSPGFEVVGLGGTFRGHDGVLKLVDELREAWARLQLVPEIVLDLGEGMLLLGTVRQSGTASGIEFEPEFAELMTVRDALVAHDQFFFGWDEGMRAAGLDPDTVTLPY